MIEGIGSANQALLATLFTWFVTALGSAMVFLFPEMKRKPLDASLGFAAGVMMAASYWSLLEPSIETARSLGYEGNMMIFPTSTGFLFGALFVLLADYLLPSVDYSGMERGDEDACVAAADYDDDDDDSVRKITLSSSSSQKLSNPAITDVHKNGAILKKEDDHKDTKLKQRHKTPKNIEMKGIDDNRVDARNINWKRILLLIIAITVHNVPEGLAVGVSFGSIGKTDTCTFAKSRNLAIGIAIQNFPEGLAVSVPLRASGVSSLKAFWYGQLSGMVEPVAGYLGALGVSLAEPMLPYVLAFAAGAMVFVVFDDIIPESQTRGNGRTASLAAIFGFIVMMILDVVLE